MARMPKPARSATSGLHWPVSRAWAAGMPKIALPITALMMAAVRSQRPMARTRRGGAAAAGGLAPAVVMEASSYVQATRAGHLGRDHGAGRRQQRRAKWDSLPRSERGVPGGRDHGASRGATAASEVGFT